MSIHPWWATFGQTVDAADKKLPAAATAFLSTLKSGLIAGATLVEVRRTDDHAAVHFTVDVERPQDLAHPIRATEPIAVIFPFNDGQPSVLALRADFPDTPHQNISPEGCPCSLCIDDRPWSEARLTATAPDLLRRFQLWLAKAAAGELHDPSQPPDPIFFHTNIGLVLPAAALTNADSAELVGYMRPDNPSLIMTETLAQASTPRSGLAQFVVLGFKGRPQAMSRMRRAPVTLMQLADELARHGIDLLEELRNRLKSWAGLGKNDVRRLGSRLAIVVSFPLTSEHTSAANDMRAFICLETLGEIGDALGALYRNQSDIGAPNAYLATLGEVVASARPLEIQPLQVHLSFNRDLAGMVAGGEADRRRAVLLGAGSIGSQIATTLTREGQFVWAIVDEDYLLPHNLARHALYAAHVGAPKAEALAAELGALLGESVDALKLNVLNPGEQQKERFEAAIGSADVIIDATASVAVSRHLADLAGTARRVCVFFNPAGTSVVLLAENEDRSITLRDLEAQYHRLVLAEPALQDHLEAGSPGVRYSGSCRTLTNRIPANKAALLSALASQGILASLEDNHASIKIWTVGQGGRVDTVERAGQPVHRLQFAPWTVTYDDGVMEELSRLRANKLPDETGGVLLGIADMLRKSIHVSHAMPQPVDSRGSVNGFERGIVDVEGEVARLVERSMHQLRYIGEWHSHPRRSSVLPSGIDLGQLVWLRDELTVEGVPALMAIAGDDGAYSILIAGQEVSAASIGSTQPGEGA
ncbi:ThiF family adenylyltransferase [Mesorhizobium sp. L2C067A000]|uniref:ThiF family adenylyltransferase n=1 Tax=Mesorhizobium sp. L2C067A000 TaxID=1287106 RepID=UPI0003D0109B|nr:ThiF family adenylyltransferase [Mesorhizobium sp. L2C067A000]ESZ26593.1 hypothetical protein X733_29440 [Mesorhizobium sp. L2C067A000]